MEDIEKNAGFEREEIYSKAIRAGKRTYFFDVKTTKRNDFYLTITESKKRFDPDGKFHFEKHKLFLYKEDFEKFLEGLNDVVKYIRTIKPLEEGEGEGEVEVEATSNFANFDFEDLDDQKNEE